MPCPTENIGLVGPEKGAMHQSEDELALDWGALLAALLSLCIGLGVGLRRLSTWMRLQPPPGLSKTSE